MSATDDAVNASLDELLDEWHRLVGNLGAEVTNQRERAERAELALTRWRGTALGAQERIDAAERSTAAHQDALARRPVVVEPADRRFYRTAVAAASIVSALGGVLVGWLL